MENVENFYFSLIYNKISSGKNCLKVVDYFFSQKIVYFFNNLMYTNRSLFILWGDGMMNVDILWANFLEQIKDELTSLSFDTWFSNTELYKLKDDKAYIIVPMPIHKKHLIDNYYQLINDTLNDITGNNYEIVLLLKEEIEEEFSKKDDNIIIVDETKRKNNSFEQTNLKSKYTFDNFIVGNSNKFAQAAALSVAENPGNMYNPLFIYGNSGLGKTHLMHAIGNYIVKNTNKRVLYVTSDQFIQDFIGINKKDDSGTNFNYVDFFKNKYRNIDVLIIDDIQFLGELLRLNKNFFTHLILYIMIVNK